MSSVAAVSVGLALADSSGGSNERKVLLCSST